ncbi:hypothetical protein PVAP13_9KG068520 [Panicum virgatum]|uniref:Uncharacterized protein n=1 Tax=Panicum virgatum TaxID=38727 RepID=A0A8T0NCN4_PANVG|nr:hypothetical protein PVAP13_9KG068520 [Panicum virgatum]
MPSRFNPTVGVVIGSSCRCSSAQLVCIGSSWLICAPSCRLISRPRSGTDCKQPPGASPRAITDCLVPPQRRDPRLPSFSSIACLHFQRSRQTHWWKQSMAVAAGAEGGPAKPYPATVGAIDGSSRHRGRVGRRHREALTSNGDLVEAIVRQLKSAWLQGPPVDRPQRADEDR